MIHAIVAGDWMKTRHAEHVTAKPRAASGTQAMCCTPAKKDHLPSMRNTPLIYRDIVSSDAIVLALPTRQAGEPVLLLYQ